jgi:hypothetical protein
MRETRDEDEAMLRSVVGVAAAAAVIAGVVGADLFGRTPVLVAAIVLFVYSIALGIAAYKASQRA